MRTTRTMLARKTRKEMPTSSNAFTPKMKSGSLWIE
jgi:hypothetical protein